MSDYTIPYFITGSVTALYALMYPQAPLMASLPLGFAAGTILALTYIGFSGNAAAPTVIVLPNDVWETSVFALCGGGLAPSAIAPTIYREPNTFTYYYFNQIDNTKVTSAYTDASIETQLRNYGVTDIVVK